VDFSTGNRLSQHFPSWMQCLEKPVPSIKIQTHSSFFFQTFERMQKNANSRKACEKKGEYFTIYQKAQEVGLYEGGMEFYCQNFQKTDRIFFSFQSDFSQPVFSKHRLVSMLASAHGQHPNALRTNSNARF
jgi:hypothetical protein